MSWAQFIPMAISAVSALGGGAKAPTSTVDKTPWGPQAEQLKNLFSSAGNLYGAGTSINQPMSPDTQAAQDMIRSGAQGFGGFMQPYNQAQNFSMGDVLSPESNPYLQKYMDAVTQNIMKGITEQALPAVRGEAITAGGYGGSRQGIAEAQAIERGAQQAGNAVSGLANSAYGQGLNVMNAALNRAPSFAALQFLPGEQMAKVGATQEQYAKNAALDPWQQLQLYQGLIGGQNWGGGATTTGQAPQTNPLMQGIGGYMAGKQLVNMYGNPPPVSNQNFGYVPSNTTTPADTSSWGGWGGV